MAILGVGSVTLTDLTDGIISGTAPISPEEGMLWIDDSGSTNVLKIYTNGAWKIETLDVSSLDPELSEKIVTITETLGTISNDKILDFNDRKIILDDIALIIGRMPSTSTGLVYPASLPDYTTLDSSGAGTFATIRKTAVEVGVAKTNGAYIGLQNAYEALNTYLSGFNPRPWDILATNATKNITLPSADTFRQKWLDYYLAEAELAVISEAAAKQGAIDYAEDVYDRATADTIITTEGNPAFTDKAHDGGSVQVEVQGISTQGDNLLATADVPVLNSAEYRIAFYPLVFKPVVGSTYTITLKGSLGADRTAFSIYNSGGSVSLTNLVSLGNGIYSTSFLWKDTNSSGVVAANTSIHVYQVANSGTSTSTIEWIQMQEGTSFTGRKGFETNRPSPLYPSEINSLGKNFSMTTEVVPQVGKYILEANGAIGSSGSHTLFEYMEAKPNTVYILHGKGSFTTYQARLYFYDKNKAPLEGKLFETTTGQNATYTSPANTVYVSVSAQHERTPTENWVLREESSTASIVIASSVGKKNLLSAKYTPSAVTNTKDFTASVWASSFYPNSQVKTILEKGKTYTFSYDAELVEKFSAPTLHTRNVGFLLYSPTGGELRYLYTKPLVNKGDKDRVEITFVCPEITDHQILYYTNRFTTNGVAPIGSDTIRFQNVKLEEELVSPYAPTPVDVQYNTQDATIYKTKLSLSEPLRSLDANVKDKVFLDATDNLWKVERQVGEKTITGSTGSTGWNLEHRLVNDAMVQMYMQTGTWNKRVVSPTKGLSNRFLDIPSIVSDNVGIMGMRPHNGYNVARFKVAPSLFGLSMDNTNAQIIAGWNTWLTDNPVTVQYVLDVPTIETLPDVQQKYLNNIATFKESNYVYTDAPDNPNLKVTFKSSNYYRNYAVKKDLTEVNSVANALKNFTDTAFADGIIERAEAQAISEHLNTLKKENDDLSNQYNGIYANALLLGAPKTNLYNAKVAYNTAYANLITSINTAISGNKTTAAQKSDVDAKFTAYSGALKLLTQRMNEALTTISGKQATDATDAVNIGDKNIVLKSKFQNQVPTAYMFGNYTLSENWEIGSEYTVVVKAPFKTGKYLGAYYNAGVYMFSQLQYDAVKGVYIGTATVTAASMGNGAVTLKDKLFFYQFPNDSFNMAVEWVKVVKGNKTSAVWTEAPEDEEERLNQKTGVPIRYIRDWTNGSDWNTGNHWNEIQVNSVTGINRAKGIPVTSNGTILSGASLATDGVVNNTYTSVTPAETPVWVQIDLGSVYYDIENIKVWHYYVDGRTYNNTKTEVSADGENWNVLFDSATEGTYPETAEGVSYSVNLIERVRIITSRVADAMIAITPDAITSTVMAQETFVNWKNTVDSKPDAETVDNLNLDMQTVAGALNGVAGENGEVISTGLLTRVSEIEQTTTMWGVSISTIEETLGSQGQVVSDVRSYMQFKETGLEIGRSDSEMKVNISNTQIDFMDNGVSVAFINGQTMFITNAEVTDSMIIGHHKFDKMTTGHTMITYSGSV